MQQKLGRGLEAIFNNRPEGESVLTIPVNKIKPNKFQPRTKFNEEHIQELANSIKKHGLLQPISVIASVVPGEYELIAGERRLRASKAAGKIDIKAIVLQGKNDEQKMNLALIENVQRQDLNPMEEAKAYQKLIDEFKHTHDEISDIVGKSRSAITNTLRLLSLPQYIQTFIDEGKISSSHGRMLAGIEDENQMKEMVDKILSDNLPVREVEKTISQIKKDKKRKSVKIQEVEIANLKDEIQRKFGTKVSIKGTNKKGKIEIFYYSLEDLERIAQGLKVSV
jgi:ParB family chromosome partitioning protein